VQLNAHLLKGGSPIMRDPFMRIRSVFADDYGTLAPTWGVEQRLVM